MSPLFIALPFGSSLRHRLTSPSVSAGPDNQEQYDSLAAYARGPEHSLRGERINAYDSACVRNYAESTPYDLQAELDDASVVSEDPKYGCEVGCLYCGQPCVRTKFGHVFHQCPEHYRWWRMQGV